MTPQEIQEAARKLQAEIGPKCELNMYVGTEAYHTKPITAYCRPRGWGNDQPRINVDGDDWQEVLDRILQEWREIEADVAKEVTRRMALAIIRITADLGQCTNAALRADEFTDEDIEAYGAKACTLADDMASNGPFRITELAGANAA